MPAGNNAKQISSVNDHTVTIKQSSASTAKKQANNPSALILLIGMGTCYALGNFTDNFYKQAIVLLAADQQLANIQSIATVLFSLPFILFSAWAGWLADHLVKKHIVIAAKTVELISLSIGCIALITGSWALMLTVVFFMGAQATAFSPALNGSIPEYFPAEQVPRVNSLIKLTSTAAILLGIGAAGVLLDLRPDGWLPSFGFEESKLATMAQSSLASTNVASPESASLTPTVAIDIASSYGRLITGIFGVLVAILGLLAAFSLKRSSPSLGKGVKANPFPWSGPVDSMRHFIECRKDPALFLVLLAEGYFYGVAAMAVVSIANLSAVLGYSKTTAALLQDMLMVGIAIGALYAGRLTVNSWRQVLLPSALGMSFFLTLLALSPLFPQGTENSIPILGNPQIFWITFMLFACGVCGGIYLIPLAGFIQVRPSQSERGKIIGVSNFFSFVAIAAWGIVFYIVGRLPAAWTFIFYGLATATFAIFIIVQRLAKLEDSSLADKSSSGLRGVFGLIMRALLGLRYKVQETGLEYIPAYYNSSTASVTNTKTPGILFLPNHPALIDPFIVYSRIAGLAPRPLIDAGQISGPIQRLGAKLLQAVIIPDVNTAKRSSAKESVRVVRAGLEQVCANLKNGNNVLLYPSGRIYRSECEIIGSNSAVAHILAEIPDVRIILVRTKGLWGSSFSRADGHVPSFIGELGKGLLWLLANGIFFAPRRLVEISFAEANSTLIGNKEMPFPRSKHKMTINPWLEDFYNEALTKSIKVPKHLLIK